MRREVLNAAGEIEKGGCVVINSRGEYLLVMNRKQGTWGLPKGHMEPGESAMQTAVRETFEETGYRVEIGRSLPDLTYLHGGTKQPIRVHLWQARVMVSDKPIDKDEIAEWVDLPEAKRRVFANVAEYLDRIQPLLVLD